MSLDFWHALALNPFLQMALFCALAASFAAGIIGSYVVSKRIVFIAGSISHAVIGGIGFFVYLHYITGESFITPFWGGILSALFFSFVIGWIHLKYRQREDSVIAAIWSIGMALGVIFISITPGRNAELMRFLFGNLLWATSYDVMILLALDLAVLMLALMLHRRFLAISFDETGAFLQKQPITFLYFTLLSLVAVTVVLLIQTIGAILVIAMLCLPAAIANLLTHRLSKMIYLAVLLSMVFTLLGIYLSYEFNWPPGSTIALVATLAYFLSLPLKARSV